MDIETLKNDLEINDITYNNLKNKRNALNIEIFRMEGVLIYIKALITAEEKKTKKDISKEEKIK